MAVNGLKRIFISDLHMNTDDSAQPASGKPYGWIGPKRITALSNFLSQIPRMGSVEDLVILGDLFDNWVCPISRDPARFREEIITAQRNRGVVNALRSLSKDLNVYYVHGNHDMLMEDSDLSDDIPGINILGNGAEPGRFRDGALVAEHGHRYCLFNCPEQSQTGVSILPSGFPVTRYYADKVNRTGRDPGYWKIIIEILKDVIEDHDDTLVKEFLHGMANACDLVNTTPVKTAGLKFFPDSVTVGQFEELFKYDFSKWDHRTQTHVCKYGALANDAGERGGNLELGALKQYILRNEANIVIFGHTHQKMLHTVVADEVISGVIIQPSKSIYANTGSWIDAITPATYIETEKDPLNGLNWVRLCAVDEYGNPEKAPLHTACVKLRGCLGAGSLGA